MTINYDIGSRYRLDNDGIHASRVAPISTPIYTAYVVMEGDTLEAIASRHFGDQRRFWEIADLNPQIQFPWDIEAGTVLRLPV